MSCLGKIVYHALSSPDDWCTVDGARHTITHKPSGLQLWVGAGPFFFTFWELPANARFDLGLIERHVLWWKAKPLVRQFRIEAQLKALGQVAHNLERAQ